MRGKKKSERQGANERRTAKVAETFGISFKRNSGADIGGRANWGIGQWGRE